MLVVDRSGNRASFTPIINIHSPCISPTEKYVVTLVIAYQRIDFKCMPGISLIIVNSSFSFS